MSRSQVKVSKQEILFIAVFQFKVASLDSRTSMISSIHIKAYKYPLSTGSGKLGARCSFRSQPFVKSSLLKDCFKVVVGL